MNRHLLIGCALLLGASVTHAQLTSTAEETIRRSMAEVDKLAAQLPPPGAELNVQIQQGMQYIKKEQYLEALAVLREAIYQKSNDERARFVAANAFMGLKRYDAALTLLETIRKDHPDQPSILNNLAWLYATSESPAIRNPARAVELAREALMLAPDNYHIWSTMAEAHYASGDYSRAQRAAEETLRMSRAQNASITQVLSYEQLVEKCRNALLAFSIIE